VYPNGKTARTDIVFHYFSKNAYENALNRALKKKKQHVAKISCMSCCKKRNSSKSLEKVVRGDKKVP
jgi:hypothetical protein